MLKHPITILGILVVALTFLGLPGSIKSPLYFLLGLFIAYLSYKEHKNPKKNSGVRRTRKPKSAVTISVRGDSSKNTFEAGEVFATENDGDQKTI